MAGLVLQTTNDVYSAAVAGNLYVEYWTGAVAHAEHYREQWDLQKSAIRALDGGQLVGFTYVNGAKFNAPDSAARDVLQKRTQDLADKLAGVAIVMPAKGFGAAVVRGVLASLNFVTRNPVATDIFSEVEPACAWLARCTNPPGDARVIEAVVAEFLQKVHHEK